MNINSSNNCSNSNTSCITTYSIELNSTTGVGCHLSDIYNITFKIGCSSDWTSDCNLQGNSVEIILQVNSENICGVLTQQVNIPATLTTYDSENSNIAQQTFSQNQIIYFRAVVIGNQIDTASTYILNCSSIFEANSTLLYFGGNSSANNGQFTSQAIDAGFAFTFNSATQANFKLNATSQLFPLATDSYASVAISCWIGVEYQNVSVKRSTVKEIRSYYSTKSNTKKLSSSITKRQSSSTNSQSMLAHATFTLVQFGSTNQPNINIQDQINSGSIKNQSTILSNFILFIFIFGIFFFL